MKRHSYFVGPVRFRKNERDQLLRLLQGSEDSVRQLEFAVALMRSAGGAAAANHETSKQVAKDADELKASIDSIVRIFNLQGSAVALFKGQLFALAGLGATSSFCSLFDGAMGEVLKIAAQRAAAEFEVGSGRGEDPWKAERMNLVGRVAVALGPHDIEVRRAPSTFVEILETVYRAAAVQQDADSDVRRFLEKRAQ